MTDLYTFLHRREMRRGDRIASVIRLALIIPLMMPLMGNEGLPFFPYGQAGFLLYGGTLFLIQRRRFLPLLSGLSLIADSLILTTALFAGALGNPEFLDRTPLLFLYPLVIYMAYLHGDDIMLVLTTILNIILYNTAFLLNMGFAPSLEGGDLLLHMGPQLFRTMILIIFSLALMEQSRRARIILRNQNDYYEKVRTRNKPLFESLDSITDRYGLSRRESEVLRELLKGKTYRSIGEDLFVSLDTIKSHVKSIYKKTGLKSRSELFQRLRLEAVETTASRNGESE
jgi:DNA-binding CsgD family transcriptional regulator